MANTDSTIGFATGSINATTYTDSTIGSASGSIISPVDPVTPTRSDSLIGFAKGSIGTVAGRSDSAIGYATSTLTAPHTPVRVWTGTAWRETAMQSYDGSTWR